MSAGGPSETVQDEAVGEGAKGVVAERARVLVVDGDAEARSVVATALAFGGNTVRALPDGTEAEVTAERFRPDLTVLETSYGNGPDGFAIARALRAWSSHAILFLSGRDDLTTRLRVFDCGADDFLPKPFEIAELVARARALLRRSSRSTPAVWELGDLVVDEGARLVLRAGMQVELTETEFQLLACLVRNRGQVLTKGQLLSRVWGFEAYDDNVVEVHMCALRRKLEAFGPRLIHTVRGAGYVARGTGGLLATACS